MLSLEGLCYRYETAPAVEAVSAQFTAGELVAVVGPNGSGKSTLLKMIARVFSPQAGRALLFNRPQSDWEPKAYAREVGYLAQESPVPFALRAIDVVLSGRAPFLGRFEWEGPKDLDAAERALERCDAAFLRARFLDEMSGGERKRVLLARVLVAEPRLILLDEPLAGLDVAHMQTFVRLLRGIVDGTGATALFVSHELNWCSAYADRMLVMHRGALVLDAPPRDVMTSAVMKRVFDFEAESLDSRDGSARWIVPGGLHRGKAEVKR